MWETAYRAVAVEPRITCSVVVPAAADTMTHFHMHLRMGAELRPDIDGLDLPDMDAVREVIRIAATDAEKSTGLSYDRYEVTDEVGRLIAIIPAHAGLFAPPLSRRRPVHQAERALAWNCTRWRSSALFTNPLHSFAPRRFFRIEGLCLSTGLSFLTKFLRVAGLRSCPRMCGSWFSKTRRSSLPL